MASSTWNEVRSKRKADAVKLRAQRKKAIPL